MSVHELSTFRGCTRLDLFSCGDRQAAYFPPGERTPLLSSPCYSQQFLYQGVGPAAAFVSPVVVKSSDNAPLFSERTVDKLGYVRFLGSLVGVVRMIYGLAKILFHGIALFFAKKEAGNIDHQYELVMGLAHFVRGFVEFGALLSDFAPDSFIRSELEKYDEIAAVDGEQERKKNTTSFACQRLIASDPKSPLKLIVN